MHVKSLMTHDNDTKDQTSQSLDVDWWVMRTSGEKPK